MVFQGTSASRKLARALFKQESSSRREDEKEIKRIEKQQDGDKSMRLDSTASLKEMLEKAEREGATEIKRVLYERPGQTSIKLGYRGPRK